MRVASNVYQMQWLASIQRKQAELAAIQQQTSTGKRVSTAADDPAGAAQALLLQQGLDDLKAVGRIATVEFVESDTIEVRDIVLAEVAE